MADTGAPYNLPYPLGTDLVIDGASDIQDLAEAVDAALDSGFRFVARRVFATPGTFTFTKSNPMGDSSVDGNLIRAYRIICVGGGGAGGGAIAVTGSEVAMAGGGSSGAYAERFALASAYGATVEVIVGAAGVPAAGEQGGNGGMSSFGGTNTRASGGRGGPRTTTLATGLRSASGGQGGPLTVDGDITIGMQPGSGAIFSSALRGSGSTLVGGNGGSSPLGAGGTGISGDVTVTLADAVGFGGGGGGRSNVGTTAASALVGGNASSGCVIVELYA
jgi:hypothetical protein